MGTVRPGKDYNPVEAGLTFACKLETSISFPGREAVEKARAAGPRRKLVSLVLPDPDVMIWGGELVLRNGIAVGQVTSGAWGEAVRGCVGLAYTRPSFTCGRRTIPMVSG